MLQNYKIQNSSACLKKKGLVTQVRSPIGHFPLSHVMDLWALGNMAALNGCL